ncbi:MAG TPA: type II secretion system protein [Candidatus Eisenbacteria bacterium]|nr:type II secretion system protein [Candidatus Eisenbacteria bacterium]
MRNQARTRKSANQGFSLIELMVVVVIIGLLASMVIPNMTRMANRAKEAAVKQNMHLLQTAVEDFSVLSTGRYPDNGTDLSDDGKTVQQLCPGAVYPENPYTHLPSSVVWDVDPNSAIPGQMGLNPATPSQYIIKGTGSTGPLSTQLTTGS